MFNCVYAGGWVCAHGYKCLQRPEGLAFPGARFTDNYKLPDIDNWNQTLICCKNSTYSLLLRHIQPRVDSSCCIVLLIARPTGHG